jgi:cystinosin
LDTGIYIFVVVFFATHSLAVTIFIAGQMFYYDGTSNFPSEHSQAIAGVLTAIAVIGFGSVMLLGGHPHTIYTLLNWLYLLSMVKVMITILKFLPQVRSNIARKSTQGWNIHGSNMDFVGGTSNCCGVPFVLYLPVYNCPCCSCPEHIAALSGLLPLA